MQQRLCVPHLVDGRAMREEQFDELRASRSIGFAVCDCQAQWRISFIRSCRQVSAALDELAAQT